MICETDPILILLHSNSDSLQIEYLKYFRRKKQKSRKIYAGRMTPVPNIDRNNFRMGLNLSILGFHGILLYR